MTNSLVLQYSKKNIFFMRVVFTFLLRWKCFVLLACSSRDSQGVTLMFFFSLHLLNFLNIYSACVFAYEVWVMERKKLVYLSFLNSSIMFFSLKKEAFIWKLVTLRVELFVSYHLVCKRIILIHPDLYSIQSNSY